MVNVPVEVNLRTVVVELRRIDVAPVLENIPPLTPVLVPFTHKSPAKQVRQLTALPPELHVPAVHGTHVLRDTYAPARHETGQFVALVPAPEYVPYTLPLVQP